MTQHIKNIVHSLFKADTWKLKLLSDWQLIVGTLADKMRLEKIEGRTVIIGVYQSSWLQELYLLSHVLKHSINEHLGHPHVTMLKFKAATKKIEKEPIKKNTKIAPLLKPIVLTQKEQQSLEKLQDPELKQVLHAFLSRCHYQKVQK